MRKIEVEEKMMLFIIFLLFLILIILLETKSTLHRLVILLLFIELIMLLFEMLFTFFQYISLMIVQQIYCIVIISFIANTIYSIDKIIKDTGYFNNIFFINTIFSYNVINIITTIANSIINCNYLLKI